MRRLFVIGTVAAISLGVGTACPGDGNGGGTGGGSGGGTGGGDTVPGTFVVTELDAAARAATYFAVAVNPATRRVGVAYYTLRGTQTVQGHDDYNLNYVEYVDGVVSAPETITYVQNLVGLSLAFEPSSGDPFVAYLGGQQGYVQGHSVFWFQSDAVYRRKTGSTWGPEVVVAAESGEVPNGDPSNNVSDMGFLVGLWPSIVFDPTGTLYYVYRDGHQGEFPQQDWNGSDVELWSGTPGALTGTMLKAGGKDKLAWGGHLQLAMGPDGPGVVYDQMFNTADNTGSNVWFQARLANGTWSAPAQVSSSSNTQTGPALAYDGTDGGTEGWGLAVVDGSSSTLTYRHRDPQTGVWTDLDPVFGSGQGGWYPSLAMDPKYHEPAIAYYVCSKRNDKTVTTCLDNEDELRVTQRVVGNWQHVVVDAEGGWAPKVGFFAPRTADADPKRFVVYRIPPAVDHITGLERTNAGELRIAVEP